MKTHTIIIVAAILAGAYLAWRHFSGTSNLSVDKITGNIFNTTTGQVVGSVKQ